MTSKITTSNRCVGYAKDGQGSDKIKPVVDGRWIFQLMDTQGLPFDMINEMLKEYGLCFDLGGFLVAAVKSGNFSKRRLHALLDDSFPETKQHWMPVLELF